MPVHAAAASDIDGPLAPTGGNSLTGSLTDTPHAPPADEFEDTGIRFVAFRDLGRCVECLLTAFENKSFIHNYTPQSGALILDIFLGQNADFGVVDSH